MSKLLKEFKADKENSATADPVTPQGGTDMKRPADKKGNGQATADKVEDLEGQLSSTPLLDGPSKMGKTAPRKADKTSMKEHMETLFDGTDLSEEFKEKIAAIFEAAVIERVEEVKSELEEQFEADFDETVDALIESMDSYLDYAISEWLEENEVAIETNTKVAIAESFMDGLKELFVEHNVELPEDGFDIIADLEEQLSKLETALNESEAEKIELQKLISEATEAEIVDELSEGLTESQKDRLKTLSENVEYTNIDEFKAKLSTIKESFVTKKTSTEENLNEEFTGVEDKPAYIDPRMAKYASALNTRKI